ncbi:MAG TPA: hypothetical protein VD963_01280 [Phycisphaerales bacterium]|nr:hypothetical protein [Phycisphaerales bacterium]
MADLSADMTHGGIERPTLDRLEGRVLPSGAFASVGLAYNASDPGSIAAVVYSVEGELGNPDPDGVAPVGGDMFVSDIGGRQFDGDLPYGAVRFLADGRLERLPNRGRRDDPDETNGTRFVTAEGFPAGWWLGDYGGREGQELEFIVEQPSSATLGDLGGQWRFSLVGIDYRVGEFFSASGLMNIALSRVDWSEDLGLLGRSTSFISQFTPQGRGVTGAGEHLYLSRDGSTLLLADMDESEGEVFVGVAVRSGGPGPDPAGLPGGYLLSWALTDPDQDLADVPIAFAQYFLELGADGAYQVLDLDRYDDGERRVIERGSWSLAGGTLRLQAEDEGPRTSLIVSAGGRTLLGTRSVRGSITDPVLGLGVRAVPLAAAAPAVLSLTHPADGPGTRAFELDQAGAWQATDVAAAAGGPAITGASLAFTDPKDNLTHVAAETAQGLVLYRGAPDGTWSWRNLTSELGAEAIVRGLTVMTGPDGLVALAGLTAGSEAVVYRQTGGATPGGLPAWSFLNIYDQDLRPAGEALPVFQGELAAYATRWGGLNLAGLTEGGRLWSLWWAPGRDRWSSTDLSAITGAPALAGTPAVLLTPWDGINLAGVDERGHVMVTWWVPQFGGRWEVSDLTALANGPRLEPDSLTGLVTLWGGLNLAGRVPVSAGADAGDVVMYWWSPERTELGWAASNLSHSALPAGTPDLLGEFHGAAGQDGSLNIFGARSNGHLLRYFWEPGFLAWAAEDVTTAAG